MKTIPFYTDDIKINVHSSTYAPFVNQAMTLREFMKACNGTKFSLYEMANNDLLFKCLESGDFIEGADAG